MPVGFLSDAERERLDSFPAQVVAGDIETYFTLSCAGRRLVRRTGSPANRLGFSLQLGTLRFLGFCPDDLDRNRGQDPLNLEKGPRSGGYITDPDPLSAILPMAHPPFLGHDRMP